jgi:phosphoenolpyruvate synthase/pyruvate phosphate dikinase
MAKPLVEHASTGRLEDGPLVVNLADLSAGRIGEVGGKAANLGELIRAGFDVPAGFCVTTAAYRSATRGTIVQDGRATDAAAARSAVLAAPFPGQVAAAIRSAYLQLGSGTDIAVAVRSSATAEDLPGASFAGQQDTYLNIAGIDNVLDAVHRCWASLWTDRAVAYRSAQEIDGAGVALAVVVQQMVDAQVAGVLFTADPVTGRRRQAVIDAAPGLGEAVVSGSVDPDRFVVDTATQSILDRRPGGSPNFCLSDQQVLLLTRLGDRVETSFGAPQDIEWAFDAAGHAWLTQSRPITTLFPVPLRRKPLPAEDFRVFFCVSLAQGLHRPITPIGIAAFRVMSQPDGSLLMRPRRCGPISAGELCQGHWTSWRPALPSWRGGYCWIRDWLYSADPDGEPFRHWPGCSGGAGPR